jgi:hypothetical protein
LSARTLGCVLLFAAGCSYTFDGDAPDLPLVGTPPPTTSLPRLNDKPVLTEQFVRDLDENVWVMMNEIDNSWRAVRLPQPGPVETFNADQVMIGYHAVYLFNKLTSDGSGPIKLTVRAVGENPGRVFTLPGGTVTLDPNGDDTAFAYFHWDKSATGYVVQQRDESFSRSIPWPKGIDPANPFQDGQFFWGDTTYYDRDKDGRIVGHDPKSMADVDLGIRPKTHFWYSGDLMTCGDDGLRRVKTDGKTPDMVIYGDKCVSLPFALRHGSFFYMRGNQIWQVKADGSAPPQLFNDLGTHRLWQLTAESKIIYSTDPADRYVYGDGDGWLDNWRFMDRGSDIQFTIDRKKLLWLEHSAQVSGAGDLTTATIPGGAPERLTRNTRYYSVLSDGRILADANHSFNGTHNRIVLVDLAQRQVHWIAQSADAWIRGPGPNDLLIDVVTGATGHDVVQTVIPPKQ